MTRRRARTQRVGAAARARGVGAARESGLTRGLISAPFPAPPLHIPLRELPARSRQRLPQGSAPVFHFPLKSGKLLFKAARKFCVFSTSVQAASGYTVPKICGKRKKGADSFQLLSSALSHPGGRGCLPRSELCAGRSGCVGRMGSERVGGVGAGGLASTEAAACVGTGHFCVPIPVSGCGHPCVRVCSPVPPGVI